jgi:hypothetical protein
MNCRRRSLSGGLTASKFIPFGKFHCLWFGSAGGGLQNDATVFGSFSTVGDMSFSEAVPALDSEDHK